MSESSEDESPATSTDIERGGTITPTPGCGRGPRRGEERRENCITAIFHKTHVNLSLCNFLVNVLISIIVLVFAIVSLIVWEFDIPNGQTATVWGLVGLVTGIWIKTPEIKRRKHQRTAPASAA